MSPFSITYLFGFSCISLISSSSLLLSCNISPICKSPTGYISIVLCSFGSSISIIFIAVPRFFLPRAFCLHHKTQIPVYLSFPHMPFPVCILRYPRIQKQRLLCLSTYNRRSLFHLYLNHLHRTKTDVKD